MICPAPSYNTRTTLSLFSVLFRDMLLISSLYFMISPSLRVSISTSTKAPLSQLRWTLTLRMRWPLSLVVRLPLSCRPTWASPFLLTIFVRQTSHLSSARVTSTFPAGEGALSLSVVTLYLSIPSYLLFLPMPWVLGFSLLVSLRRLISGVAPFSGRGRIIAPGGTAKWLGLKCANQRILVASEFFLYHTKTRLSFPNSFPSYTPTRPPLGPAGSIVSMGGPTTASILSGIPHVL